MVDLIAKGTQKARFAAVHLAARGVSRNTSAFASSQTTPKFKDTQTTPDAFGCTSSFFASATATTPVDCCVWAHTAIPTISVRTPL